MPGSPAAGATDLGRATALIRQRSCPAQICVRWRGHVVLDQAFGCPRDGLFFLFAASKPLVALAVHMLAERGSLSLDEPVARYWPAFGQLGKQTITIRQVLQHRSGLPVARSFARDALVMTDWNASVRAIELAKPTYPPGQVPAYHVLSYGFILGELVQRVTGAAVQDFIEAELLAPLGLRNMYLGLPRHLWSRHVPVRGRGSAELAMQVVINQRSVRQAVIPAASVSATARDLAGLYQALLTAANWRGRACCDPKPSAALPCRRATPRSISTSSCQCGGQLAFCRLSSRAINLL